MEQAAKSLFRERHRGFPPESFGGFGGVGVLLVGDFGQLPPVLASSLIATNTTERGGSGLRFRASQGHMRFKQFDSVIQLRRLLVSVRDRMCSFLTFLSLPISDLSLEYVVLIV